MSLDPKGYYARLGVEPDSPASAIHAAFRSKAKRLHPDVPVTGNLAAFLRLKEAYEVLSDALSRGEYDRSARASPAHYNSPRLWAGFDPPINELEARLPPEPPAPDPFVMPVRPSVLAWSGVGLIVAVGIGGAVWGLTRSTPAPQYNVAAVPSAPHIAEVPAEPPGVPANPGPGTPYYIQPVAGTAVLWRYDDADQQYRPDATLKPFTPVLMLRLVSHGALAEVQIPGGKVGYIYPHLLAPGDTEAAERAACIFHAGDAPQNGEILPPPADAPAPPLVTPPATPLGAGDGGSAGVTATVVNNQGDAPIVVTLRRGHDFVAIYVNPHARARLPGLPEGDWRIDWASGDLWSRSCFRFMAGMRSRRLEDATIPPAITLPAELGTDIPDKDFGR